jgi:hypothetical protein
LERIAAAEGESQMEEQMTEEIVGDEEVEKVVEIKKTKKHETHKKN